ncbi:hypothetical protein JL722_3029 [Aureococcus anophagefferens]|nr:hypothetical protein JL722_3029 [Aureococcus anophagefferens]
MLRRLVAAASLAAASAQSSCARRRLAVDDYDYYVDAYDEFQEAVEDSIDCGAGTILLEEDVTVAAQVEIYDGAANNAADCLYDGGDCCVATCAGDGCPTTDADCDDDAPGDGDFLIPGSWSRALDGGGYGDAQDGGTQILWVSDAGTTLTLRHLVLYGGTCIKGACATYSEDDDDFGGGAALYVHVGAAVLDDVLMSHHFATIAGAVSVVDGSLDWVGGGVTTTHAKKGGTVSVAGSSAIMFLRDVAITYNEGCGVVARDGAFLNLTASNVTHNGLDNAAITQNTDDDLGGVSNRWGGGVAIVLGATATIAGCNVSYNEFPGGKVNQVEYFGGIAVYDSNAVTISDTLVSHNEAKHHAGVAVESSQVSLHRVTLRGNVGKEGGGFYAGVSDNSDDDAGSDVHLYDCVFEGNTATRTGSNKAGGGGMQVSKSNVWVYGGTFSGNVASNDRGHNAWIEDNTDLYLYGVASDSGTWYVDDATSVIETCNSAIAGDAAGDTDNIYPICATTDAPTLEPTAEATPAPTPEPTAEPRNAGAGAAVACRRPSRRRTAASSSSSTRPPSPRPGPRATPSPSAT